MMGNKAEKQEKEKRDQGFYIRMTKSEMSELDMASYATEEEKSSIVRKALKMYLSTLNGRY